MRSSAEITTQLFRVARVQQILLRHDKRSLSIISAPSQHEAQ